LAADVPDLPQKLEVQFYGRIAPEERGYFDNPALKDIVTVNGYLAHADCGRAMCESDVLLLLLDDLPGAERVPTAKIFEYLAAKRYILAVAPEGEAASLVRGCRAGAVVRPRDVTTLRKTLAELVRSPESIRRHAPQADAVERFSRKRETQQLAELLDTSVATNV
jgi:glycosyltransferase involved in cell wall biosynthesis